MTTQSKALPEITLASLVEVTEDPVDAMKLAADLFAMTAYRAERAFATSAGLTEPRPPKPRSKYMRRFWKGLRVKLTEVARHFDEDDVERLKRIAPALLLRMDGDSTLADELVKLICMEPDDAAAWIHEHLEEIEARFAS